MNTPHGSLSPQPPPTMPLAAPDERRAGCGLFFLARSVRFQRFMVRAAACLLLTAMVGSVRADSDAEAESLLKSIRDKYQSAKTLQVDIKMEATRQKRVEYSGSVYAKGESLWGLELVRKVDADPPVMQRAFCDGKLLNAEGFKHKSDPAFAPDRYNRQLREWCATSFIVLFSSMLWEEIDQGDDNFPVVSDVKFYSREKLRDVDTVVITYALKYPGGEAMTVKAWIAAKTNMPIQRIVTNKHGLMILETIGNVAVDKGIPDSKFTLQPSASGTPSPAEKNQKPGR